MQYSVEEIKQYAAEEDVKFIRMAFCDAALAAYPEMDSDNLFETGGTGPGLPVRYRHRRLRHSRLRRGGPL